MERNYITVTLCISVVVELVTDGAVLFLTTFDTRFVISVTKISVKNLQFKTFCKDDCGWITQLKQQI